MAFIYPCFEEEFMVIYPNQRLEIQSEIKKIIERSEITKVENFIDNTLIKFDILDATEYSSLMFNRNDKPIEITKNVKDIVETEDFIRIPYTSPIGVCYFTKY